MIKGTKSLYLVLGAVICYLIYIFFPVKISMSVNYYSNTYLTVVSGMAIVVLYCWCANLSTRFLLSIGLEEIHWYSYARIIWYIDP